MAVREGEWRSDLCGHRRRTGQEEEASSSASVGNYFPPPPPTPPPPPRLSPPCEQDVSQARLVSSERIEKVRRTFVFIVFPFVHRVPFRSARTEHRVRSASISFSVDFTVHSLTRDAEELPECVSSVHHPRAALEGQCAVPETSTATKTSR